MVADDTAGSGDRSEGEKELDLTAPASEDTDGHVDRDVEMAVSASEAPSTPEDPPGEAGDPRKWSWAVIFLCFYGFMSVVKPGEPFITPYLLSREKNFTREQVSGDITLKYIRCVFICTGIFVCI